MELLVDTGAGREALRFDADAGLTGEAVRARRPVVAHGLERDQVVLPSGETPGAEVLVPLYHAGQLVGLWSVRHSDPQMYRESDGEIRTLLAPQLALMLALEGAVQPVVGASEQVAQYVQSLTATSEEIHASSQEVAASAQRASTGSARAADLVTAVAREAAEFKHGADQAATVGEETRAAGAQMEQTADRVRTATQTAFRRLTELGGTTEESVGEVRRLRDVAAQVEKFSETIGFIANQTNLLALNATIEAARAGAGRGGPPGPGRRSRPPPPRPTTPEPLRPPRGVPPGSRGGPTGSPKPSVSWGGRTAAISVAPAAAGGWSCGGTAEPAPSV